MPYLPVSASVQSATGTPRTVKLAPMIADGQFHYGADVALGADTSKITIAIGKPTIPVAPSAGRVPRGATSVTFEWRP